MRSNPPEGDVRLRDAPKFCTGCGSELVSWEQWGDRYSADDGTRKWETWLACSELSKPKRRRKRGLGLHNQMIWSSTYRREVEGA